MCAIIKLGRNKVHNNPNTNRTGAFHLNHFVSTDESDSEILLLNETSEIIIEIAPITIKNTYNKIITTFMVSVFYN